MVVALGVGDLLGDFDHREFVRSVGSEFSLLVLRRRFGVHVQYLVTCLNQRISLVTQPSLVIDWQGLIDLEDRSQVRSILHLEALGLTTVSHVFGLSVERAENVLRIALLGKPFMAHRRYKLLLLFFLP